MAPAFEPHPPPSPLRGLQWSLVYAAFLLYIFVVTTYQLGIADLAMVAALGALLLQREELKIPSLLLWLGLFLAWNAIAYVQTEYPAIVWEQLKVLTKLWLVTLVVVNALRTRAHVRLFILVFAASFALYPLRGAMFNYYLYHSSVLGRAQWNFIYANPNDLAALALLQLSMIGWLLVTEPKGWLRWAAMLGAGLVPLLILMTQSRGAFIALCGFTAFALFGPRVRQPSSSPRRSHRGRWFAFAAVGALVVFIAPSGVWERVRGLKSVANTDRLEEVDREGSAKQRFEIWKVATRIIIEQPVLGVGMEAYGLAHEKYVYKGGFDLIAAGRKDPHSTVLKVAAEAGVPGLVLFLTLVGSAAIYADRTRRRSRHTLPRSSAQLYYLEIGLLAFFIAGIFGSFYRLSFLYIHVALLYVMARIVDEDLAAAQRPRWRAPILPQS